MGASSQAAALPTKPVEPRQALEDVIRAALVRAPCLVSFSGGRDSSAVLAVASALARREGHPLPIPATQRFKNAPDTEESQWQNLVIGHLSLHEWHIMELDDELDLIGPVATEALRRHGVRYPPNAHGHIPMLQAAAGGSLLTGLDGDGVLGGWRYRGLSEVLCGFRRPTRHDRRPLAAAAVPPILRRFPLRGTANAELEGRSWLSTEGLQHLQHQHLAEQAHEPVRWRKRLEWFAQRRYLGLACETLALFAADAAADIFHPLLNARFLSSLGALGPWRGGGGRTDLMHRVFGDVLPRAVIERRDKATFNTAYWTSATVNHVRLLAEEPPRYDFVDTAALQKLWKTGAPAFGTALLLQQARLSVV